MISYFFAGKGGTGKTTVAAGFAMQLAAGGHKTLLVSLDPAHSIGDILDPASADGKELSGNLTVQEPDFDRINEDYLKRQLDTLREMNNRLTAFSLDHLLDTLEYSPGQEEYAVILHLKSVLETEDDNYEYAVFDTPPTGMILRIFSLPLRSRIWLDKLAALRRKIVDRRELIGEIRKKEQAEDYYRKDPVLDKLKELSSEYSALEEFFRDRARVYLVLNNDRLALAESARLKQKLERMGIRLSGIINNKFRESESTALLESTGFDPGEMIQVPELKADRAGRYSLPQNLSEELIGNG
ncbi:MAG: TRC40/GET3/ArsA family transport-energizing ATPase [Candidatus Krumholzibacteriales bacterium]